MRKILFIMMFAIAGCFDIALAQVEQTTPQNSGTMNQNSGATPNSNSTTTPQGNMQNQGTSTTSPQGTYEKQDTSRTTTKGTYEKRQGTMNNSQGTMNKSHGKMTHGKMKDTHSAMSQNEKGWTKIGEKTLNLSKDREEIAVSGAEKFSSIKIKVPEDAMVDLKNVIVEYEGGTKQNVDMSSAVSSATDESKIIELNSTDRNVKKISFAYEPRESKNSMSMNNGSTSGTKGKNSSSMDNSSSSMGTSSSTMDTSSNSMGKNSNSMGNSSGTNGTMDSKSTKKGTMGTSERGTKGSKAKIEVWGLRSDTALK